MNYIVKLSLFLGVLILNCCLHFHIILSVERPRPLYFPCSNFQRAKGPIFNVTLLFVEVIVHFMKLSDFFFKYSFVSSLLLWPLLGRCPEIACDGNGTEARLVPQARSLEPKADALLQPSEDGALMASYSVFVLEPGEQVGKFHEINKIFLTSHILPPTYQYFHKVLMRIAFVTIREDMMWQNLFNLLNMPMTFWIFFEKSTFCCWKSQIGCMILKTYTRAKIVQDLF